MELDKPVSEPEVEQEEQEVDFLAEVEAADPESFNVCTFGCD